MQLVLGLDNPVAHVHARGCSFVHSLLHLFVNLILHQAEECLYGLLLSSEKLEGSFSGQKCG